MASNKSKMNNPEVNGVAASNAAAGTEAETPANGTKLR